MAKKKAKGKAPTKDKRPKGKKPVERTPEEEEAYQKRCAAARKGAEKKRQMKAEAAEAAEAAKAAEAAEVEIVGQGEVERFTPDTAKADADAAASVTAEDIAHFCTTKPAHVEFRADTPFEVWLAVTDGLMTACQMGQFALGDALLWGEGAFGEMYSQAIKATGLAKQTLMNWVSVAKKVPPKNRLIGLDFSHHVVCAKVEELPLQKEILKQALDEQLSVKATKEIVRVRLGLPEPPTPTPPEKFAILDDEDALLCVERLAAYMGRGDSDDVNERGDAEAIEQWNGQRREPWEEGLQPLADLMNRILPG